MNFTSIDSGSGLSRYFVGIHKWENGCGCDKFAGSTKWIV